MLAPIFLPVRSSILTQDGTLAGRMLYDAYGGLQSSTLTPELAAVFDNADTTGLTHLGNGRYYDPSLGRPLQPNPHGGIPVVPQSLNRYAASALGQVGVAEAAANTGLSSGLLHNIGTTLLSGVAGEGASRYANYYGYLSVYSSRANIQRNYQGLFRKVNPTNRSIDLFHSRRSVKPLGNERFQVVSSNRIIDLRSEFPRLNRRGTLLERYFVSKDNVLRQFLRSGLGEVTSGLVVDATLAIPNLISIGQNPYLNPTQQRVQTAVEGAGILAGVLVALQVGKQASALGGPVPFILTNVAGFGVLFAWDYAVKPSVSYVFTSVFNAQDPYDDSRRLAPLNQE